MCYEIPAGTVPERGAPVRLGRDGSCACLRRCCRPGGDGPRACAKAAARGSAKSRVESVDLLRGLAIVFMALDHVRDYFSSAQFSPADLDQTTPALFFTRWVTHFCAPVFVALAGTGVYLSARRGKTRPELARFLVIRGAWLILLELTVLRFGMCFSLDYHWVSLTILWAIGWSMIALAGLICAAHAGRRGDRRGDHPRP